MNDGEAEEEPPRDRLVRSKYRVRNTRDSLWGESEKHVCVD